MLQHKDPSKRSTFLAGYVQDSYFPMRESKWDEDNNEETSHARDPFVFYSSTSVEI